MAIEFRCGQCGRLLRTGDETAGRMAQCPVCGTQTPIPVPTEEPLITPIAVEPNEAGASAAATSGSPGGTPFGAGPAELGAGENPYQSPQQAWQTGGPSHPSSPSYAMNRVSGPAVGLIVTGGLGLFIHIAGMMVSIFLPFPVMGNNPNAQQVPIFIQPMFGVGFAIAEHALGLALGVLLLAAGAKMKNLENYGLCTAASIIAMIPCFSPCCLLGLPIGIWALVVLNDPYVRSSFR